MSDIPVSSKIAPAPWPRAGVPEYLFTMRSAGGPLLGVGVLENDWRMQIDSKRGLLTVESFRSPGDTPGQPIGLFRERLTDAALIEFHQLFVEAKLDEIKPEMKRHPGPTQRQYTMTNPPVKLVINNSDEETNAKIQPLRTRIYRLLGGSFEHPERSVKVELKHIRQPLGDAFEITVTNNGLEKVCFTDPRWIPTGGPLHRAVVLVAEWPRTGPGEAPPFFDWKEVPMAPFKPVSVREPLVTLDPGSVWEGKTAIWKHVPGKRYIAYFTWANFEGDPLMNGVYRFRGKVDSARRVIE